MSTLVLFPWLTIDEPIDIGEFALIPYERGVAPEEGTELQEILDALTEPYSANGDEPIRRASFLSVGGHDLLDDLSEDESNAVFAFSELLAAAGLSKREFFQGAFGYCNRDVFRVVIQSFNDPRGGTTQRIRRRDGITTNYTSRDAFRVRKPDYISAPFGPAIDLPLLRAFAVAQSDMSDAEWEAVFEAIISFNSANTDSPFVSVQAEVVAMNGAFERLFDLRAGRENELADAFSTILQPAENTAPGDCERFASPDFLSRFRRSATIRDMWIRDFFRTRGSLAHGRLETTHPSLWNIHDHLLLASFVFPLVLKLHLSSKGYYELTWLDEVHVDAFERLACEEHCIEREDEAEWPWRKIIGDIVADRCFGDYFRDAGEA
jgi:hypothetical protein